MTRFDQPPDTSNPDDYWDDPELVAELQREASDVLRFGVSTASLLEAGLRRTIRYLWAEGSYTSRYTANLCNDVLVQGGCASELTVEQRRSRP